MLHLLRDKAVGAVRFLPAGREILVNVLADQSVDIIRRQAGVGVGVLDSEKVVVLDGYLCILLKILHQGGAGHAVIADQVDIEVLDHLVQQVAAAKGVGENFQPSFHRLRDGQSLNQIVDDALLDKDRR